MWEGIFAFLLALLLWLQPVATPTPVPKPPVVASPAPTLRAMPLPIATPRPVPKAKSAPVPTASTSASHRLYLTGAYGLNTPVTYYSDCSGATPLTSTSAAIDTCASSALLYFVGHNYGVFTPLMSMHIGDPITYWDAAGVAHVLHVTVIRDNFPAGGAFPPPIGPYEFQTCTLQEVNSPTDRIIDASP